MKEERNSMKASVCAKNDVRVCREDRCKGEEERVKNERRKEVQY